LNNTQDGDCSVPREPLLRLFLRFLRFGALAWGGPVAQIAMIRQELVEEERWISGEQFNRVLALYQALPGPEALKLCVYFAMLSRGRWGGLLAGLGFMLPGFVLMFGVSWAYVHYGLDADDLQAAFAAVQVAAAALIVRALVSIGGHALGNRWLWLLAALAACAHLAGVHFGLILLCGGLVYVLARTGRPALASAVSALAAAAVVLLAQRVGGYTALDGLALGDAAYAVPAQQAVPLLLLFWSGMKAGLLSFGGAYTAIPFVQRDAVGEGGWMSNAQFMDGLALAGLLPAPLVIFSTFVGYLGGGPWGAVSMTAGMFLPAFALTLAAHEPLEQLMHHAGLRLFLEGVTAAVVGMIAGTALALLHQLLDSLDAMLVFAVALGLLFAFRARLLTPALIVGAALWGGVLRPLAGLAG
jgi:chromate transporter